MDWYISYKELYTIKTTLIRFLSSYLVPLSLSLLYEFILSIFSKACASHFKPLSCQPPPDHNYFSSPPPHPSSACLVLLPHHSIRLLNTILTPVINNRLVIPLSINFPPSLLWGLAISQSPWGLIYSLPPCPPWLILSSPLSFFTKSVLCQLLSFSTRSVRSAFCETHLFYFSRPTSHTNNPPFTCVLSAE